MTMLRHVSRTHAIMGKLEHGCDLLGELTRIACEEGILLGQVRALGAVQKARLAYYAQDAKTYQFFELDQHLEIAQLVGNISLKDGRPMVHAHVTLSDAAGKAYGGHLAAGTIVFACEVVIDVMSGPEFVRGHDEVTGLPLWTES